MLLLQLPYASLHYFSEDTLVLTYELDSIHLV